MLQSQSSKGSNQTDQNSPELQIQQQTLPKARKRCFGISIIFVEVGILIGYILKGEFYPQPQAVNISHTQSIVNIFLIFLTLFGFGLLLSIWKFGSWLGGGSCIIIVSVILQLGPLLQKFFFSAIIMNFSDSPDANQVSDQIRNFWRHYQLNEIDSGYLTLRTAILTSISLLTVLISIIGRPTLSQVFKLSVIFPIFWNLNYFLLIRLAVNFQEGFSPKFFDSFGISYIFLFGSVFGLTYNLFLSKQKFPTNHINAQIDKFSLNLSTIGSITIFLLFSFIDNSFYDFSAYCKSVSVINVQAALLGSVIGTYITSSLSGNAKLGYKQCLVGIISGGIIIGSVAPLLSSLGEAIGIGIGSGFLSGIYMQTIDKKINKNYIYDSIGLFGSMFIASFICNLLIQPLLIATNDTICIQQDIEINLAGAGLSYTGVTIGVGIVGGFICGIFSLFDRQEDNYSSNFRYFSQDYGNQWLKDIEEESSLANSQSLDWDLLYRALQNNQKRREQSRGRLNQQNQK